jgi:Mitochondrial genome maintenance MGM101
MAKPSTALARRNARSAAKLAAQEQRLERIRANTATTLSEDALIGPLGLVEVKLKKREEEVLARPVNIDDVLIKPTGQPYLSHPTYTRWFNDAFGRTGWTLAPASKPVITQPDESGRATITQAYMLYIHGQPAAFAMGEQEYHATNREQTFGDALEATNASALRRCAKRLGVGLELWDKRFLNKFIAERCVKVWVEGDQRPKWRRVDDPPLPKEKGTDTTGRTAMQRELEHPASHSKLDEPITEGQLRRLWTITGHARRAEADVRAWLEARYGIKSMKEIPRRQYDEICNWIEQSGPLPAKAR